MGEAAVSSLLPPGWVLSCLGPSQEKPPPPGPCQGVSRTAPPACGKGALSASTAPLSPPLTQGHTACRPCHLILTLQADTSSCCQLGSCAAVPKTGGKIVPQLPCGSWPPLLLVRWDGLDPGQELLPSPSSETKARARRWDLQAPNHVQTVPGSPRCVNPSGEPTMCKLPLGCRQAGLSVEVR